MEMRQTLRDLISFSCRISYAPLRSTNDFLVLTLVSFSLLFVLSGRRIGKAAARTTKSQRKVLL